MELKTDQDWKRVNKETIETLSARIGITPSHSGTIHVNGTIFEANADHVRILRCQVSIAQAAEIAKILDPDSAKHNGWKNAETSIIFAFLTSDGGDDCYDMAKDISQVEMAVELQKWMKDIAFNTLRPPQNQTREATMMIKEVFKDAIGKVDWMAMAAEFMPEEIL